MGGSSIVVHSVDYLYTARYGWFIYSSAFSGLSIFIRLNALTYCLRNFQPPCVYVTVHGFKVVVGFAYISQIIMY